MLIGKSQNVAVRYSTNGEDLPIQSPVVEFRVQSNPFRLLAYRLDSPNPFWKQRLSDLFTSDVIPTSIASHEGCEAAFEAFTLDPAEAVFVLDGQEHKVPFLRKYY